MQTEETQTGIQSGGKQAMPHGFSVRGDVFEGKVVSAKASKTVTVEREIVHFVKKYERYKKVKSRIRAHNPPEIGAAEGDTVIVGETRRISKTKNFVVLSVAKKGGVQ